MSLATSRLGVLVTILVSMTGSTLAAPVRLNQTLPIVCPAIQREPELASILDPKHPLWESLPVEAVVVGRVRVPVPDTGQQHKPRPELLVDRVIGGFCKQERISIPNEGDWPKGRAIFHLHSTIYSKRPFVRYLTGDLREEKGYRALWSARFDYRVLSSKGIFVGKLTGFDSRRAEGSVEVLRPLGKASPPKGSVVACLFLGGESIGTSRTRPIDDTPRIFVVGSILPEEDVIELGETEPTRRPPIHVLSLVQPTQTEREIQAALQRRSAYPISDVGVDLHTSGTELKSRPRSCEVIFRGPIEDAIGFLGSEDYRIRALGYGTLFQRAKESKPTVAAAIRKAMLDFGIGTGRHQRLYYLVRLLGMIESRDDRYPSIETLIDVQIDALASKTLPPQTAKPTTEFDRNRSLFWLLRELPSDVAYRRYSKSMSALLARSTRPTRKYVQFMVDRLGFETQRELAEALLRLGPRRLARRSSPWLETSSCRGAFSRDGKYYAQATYVPDHPGGQVRLWRVSDWSEVRTIWTRGFVSEQVFSPDGRWLYVVVGPADKPTRPLERTQRLLRIDVGRGRVDREYCVSKRGLANAQLSADGKRLACCVEADLGVGIPLRGLVHLDPDDEPCEIRVFDTRTGKTLYSIPADIARQEEYQLHPSGTWLVHRTRPETKRRLAGPIYISERFSWEVASLGGKPPKLPPNERKDELLFVGERYLLTREFFWPRNEDEEWSIVLSLRDLEKNTIVSSFQKFHRWCRVRIDNKGNVVASFWTYDDALGRHRRELVVLDVPTLRELPREKKVADVLQQSIAGVLSPTANLAVVENEADGQGPILLDLATGKRSPLDRTRRASPDIIHIGDTSEQASEHRCWDFSEGRLVFSRDGSRYAISTKTVLDDDRVSSWLTPRQPEPIVRIHDTKTSQLLEAFRLDHEVKTMRFDASGKRLAVVLLDETLEVWQLRR